MKNNIFFDLKFNIIFLGYFLIVCCTDDKVIMIPEQEITQTSSDYIKCEVYFNSIVYEIEKGFSSNVSSRTFPIYINHNLNPLNEDTLIIDYGNSNTLINGKFFRGRIINIYSGSVNDTNFNCSSNFDNFYLNNNLINGTITIDNNEGEIQIINGEVTDISGKKCKIKLNSGDEILANPIRVKSKGEKSIVSLRPERALINPKDKMDNMFNGKIEEVIYHGDHTRVRLNLLDNNEFILKVPNSSARMDIKLGNQIKIGWNSFDARALDPK